MSSPQQKRQFLIIRGVLVALAVIIGMLAPRYANVAAVAENWASDLRVSFLNPPASKSDIVILAIDETTLSLFPYRSPLDRVFLAGLLRQLDALGVMAVGLDIFFDQATEPEKDKAFQDAARSMKAPLVVGWTNEETGLTPERYQFQMEFLEGIGAGYSNLGRDPVDGTIRFALPRMKDKDGNERLIFAAAIAKAVGVEPPREDLIRIDFRGLQDLDGHAFPTYPAHALPILARQESWFRNKIVLIGATLPFEDRHRTPFAAGFGVSKGSLPGLVIQAHLLDQMLEGRPGRVSHPELEFVVLLALSLVGATMVSTRIPITVKVVGGLAVLGVFWTGTLWVYSAHALLLPMVIPSFAFGGVVGGGSIYAGRLQARETEYIRHAFSHYLAPSVIRKIESDPGGMALGGGKRFVTLLFTDVEGFTTFSETLEPTRLVAILNEYLDGLSTIVMEHGGMVDKFIGDALMAVFGAPDEQPDHAARAVACALELNRFGHAFTARQAAVGITFGRTRIGVHSGEAVVGNIGGRARFDYTAIGDTVNTASRFEGVNKYFGTDICVSGFTADLARDTIRFRSIGTLIVKGKHEGIPAFEPVATEATERADSYDHLFAMIEAGNPDVEQTLEQHLSRFPGDRLAEYHLQRARDGMVSARIKLEGK